MSEMIETYVRDLVKRLRLAERADGQRSTLHGEAARVIERAIAMLHEGGYGPKRD